MTDQKTAKTACPNCSTLYKLPDGFIGKTVSCKRCGTCFKAVSREATKNYPLIGKLALKYGLVAEDQLEIAMTCQAANSTPEKVLRLEDILLDKGLITDQQVSLLHLAEKYWQASQLSKGFCAVAVAKGLITRQDADEALKEQSATFSTYRAIRKVRDILFESGKITAEQRDAVLAEQGRMGQPPPQIRAASSPSGEPAQASPANTVSPRQTNAGTVKEPETINAAVEKGEFDLIVSEDKMTATLRPSGGKPASNTLDYIHRLLESEKIISGIVPDDQIAHYLTTEALKGSAFVVAHGVPLKPGTDAILKYHFETKQKVGSVTAGGAIDYRDRGRIPHVNKDDILIEKIPKTSGDPGITVYGMPVPAPKPTDIKLRCGAGAKVSEDGLKVIALVSGQPKMTFGGRLSVLSELKITGDVDLKTGHVDFDGNIVITGCVQSGFRVKGHSITAKEIMGAEITATGDIKVAGGIIGAVINCQGNISAKFVKSARISAFGNLSVSKEITDSTIEISGACRVDNGKILAAVISAKQGICALEIGTDVSTPCKLSAGVDAHIERETQGIQNVITRCGEHRAQLKEKMTALDIEQQTLHQRITHLAQVQDRSLVERREVQKNLEKLKDVVLPNAVAEAEKKAGELMQKANEAETELSGLFEKQEKTEEQLAALEKTLSQLEDEIEELNAEKQAICEMAQKTKSIAVVSASGPIHVGTLVTGLHTHLRIRETCRHVRIQEVKVTDPDAAADWEMRITPFK